MEITIEELRRQLEPQGWVIINKSDLEKIKQDYYLHQYDSYEQYREIQIFNNKRKLEDVWADQKTLNLVIRRLLEEFGSNGVRGLCHGTRNGFEQAYLAEQLGCDVVGTDISETAVQFPRSVQWDFHDVNPEWEGVIDFIYTNSLDQSWQPRIALTTWLGQLRTGGILFIEHTLGHSPSGAGDMDPFGAKPQYLPYLLATWFGHQIAIEVIKGVKENYDLEVWLFVIKKLYSKESPA